MRLLTLIMNMALIIAFPIAVSAKEPTVIPGIEMVDVEGGTFLMTRVRDKERHETIESAA